jgi:hypothetical protein
MTTKQQSKSSEKYPPLNEWKREDLVGYVECLSDQLQDASDTLLSELTSNIENQASFISTLSVTDREIEQAILDGLKSFKETLKLRRAEALKKLKEIEAQSHCR